MTSLLATAEGMLIDRIISSQAPLTGKSKAELGLFSLSGLLLCAALVFFIYAAFLWLISNYTPEIAAMAAGCMCALAALTCAAGAFAFLKYKRARISKMKGEIMETMQTALEIAEEELRQPIQDNPKTAVLVASMAGFIAGEKLL